MRVAFISLGALIALLFGEGCNRQSFTMLNESMKPTIQPGDRITVDMSAYRIRPPRRWDVVAFHPVDDRYKDNLWVMRIVGLPGERIAYAPRIAALSDGRITYVPRGNILIDDKAPEQPAQIRGVEYTLGYQTPFVDTHPGVLAHPLRVPADSYYVLGDNVEGAYDSRYWGALPRKNIAGKVLDK
jgi:signal peptidase I